MDIQSIIKQVLALAEGVIKNPSTSVASSGIDLSALTQIAGSFLGGGSQQQNSSGSALGSILGSAISSGALGSLLGGGSNNNQQSGQSSSGSTLGSILGSAISSGALGGLLGGSSQQQPQQEASNSDLLGQLTSKASIIKDMLTGASSSNLSNDQKGNLNDVLNIVNIAKGFLGK
ncbi:MAG: hypothetical protein IKR41_05135 [Bacteroidales bacterium]|nr:hypothetical protein [Bacteroidales bacterium]